MTFNEYIERVDGDDLDLIQKEINSGVRSLKLFGESLVTSCMRDGVTGWPNRKTVGLEIQRPEIRTPSAAQEQIVRVFLS